MKKPSSVVHTKEEIELIQKNLKEINELDLTIKDKSYNKVYLSLVNFPISQAIERMLISNDFDFFDKKVEALGGIDVIKNDKKVQEFAKLKETAVAEKISKKDSQAIEVLKRFLPLLKRKTRVVAEYTIIACMDNNPAVMEYLVGSEFFPECSFLSTLRKNNSYFNNLLSSPQAETFFKLFGHLQELDDYFRGNYDKVAHLMRSDATPDWLKNKENILFSRSVEYKHNYNPEFYDQLCKIIDVNSLNADGQNPITFYAAEINKILKEKENHYYIHGEINRKLSSIKILFHNHSSTAIKDVKNKDFNYYWDNILKSLKEVVKKPMNSWNNDYYKAEREKTTSLIEEISILMALSKNSLSKNKNKL